MTFYIESDKSCASVNPLLYKFSNFSKTHFSARYFSVARSTSATNFLWNFPCCEQALALCSLRFSKTFINHTIDFRDLTLNSLSTSHFGLRSLFQCIILHAPSVLIACHNAPSALLLCKHSGCFIPFHHADQPEGHFEKIHQLLFAF